MKLKLLFLLLLTTVAFSFTASDYNLVNFADSAEYSFDEVDASINFESQNISWAPTKITFFNAPRGLNYVWMRYRIPLNIEVIPSSLVLAETFFHAEVYLDNTLIAKKLNMPYFHVFDIPDISNFDYLYLKIYVKNSSFPQVGSKHIYFGDKTDIFSFFIAKDLPLFVISCFFIIVGVAVLMFYLINIGSLELFATSILLISVGVTFSLMNSIPSMLPIPNSGELLRSIQLFSTYPIAISAFMLLSLIFVSRFRYIAIGFSFLYVALFVLSTVELFFTSQDINFAFGVFRQIVPITTGLIALSAIYESFIKRNIDAQILLFGVISLAINATSNVLVNVNRLNQPLFLYEIGFFIFLCSILFISIRRYMLLTHEVTTKNNELLALNMTLEDRVYRRTAELEQVNDELLESNNNLKDSQDTLNSLLKKYNLK